VVLSVRFEALEDLERPIVGFLLKNQLGQLLFGENTYLTYRDAPVFVPGGREATARFAFRLPYLPPGEYVVSVSVAEGTQETHVQHHWIHDALVFRCQTSHTEFGLIGMPMSAIEISVDDEAEAREGDARSEA
jgi:lipopolysaccharide transport system ATP-binding protein